MISIYNLDIIFILLYPNVLMLTWYDRPEGMALKSILHMYFTDGLNKFERDAIWSKQRSK